MEKPQTRRPPWRWGALGLILFLLLTWTGLQYSTAYAHLAIIQAKKLTVYGKPAVQLFIQTDQGAGREIHIKIGKNKITFQTDPGGFVDTGNLEIPQGATEVAIQMPNPGDELWPAACTIPLDQIPQQKDAVRVAACVDSTPPITDFSQNPGQNGFGWNNGEVKVVLKATDGQSGVKQVCYELSGAQSQGQRCVSGAQASFTMPTSPNGETTIRYFAEDKWVNKGKDGPPGPNREDPKTAIVRIDTGPPSISGSRSPDSNRNGWNNGPVRVSFSCSDSVSGIPSGGCRGDTTLSSDGANQSVTGWAEDRAGNTNSATVGGINIDMTPPVIQWTGKFSCSLPGNNNWCRGTITVSFVATDNLSGFSNGQRTASFERSTSQEGNNVFVKSGTIEDLAGNQATPAPPVGPFGIDSTGPVVNLQGVSSPFPQGGPARVSWNVTDSLSGVDTSSCLATISGSGVTSTTLSTRCQDQVTLSPDRFGEGTFTVRVAARDGAGNEGTDLLRVELRRLRQPPKADFSCSPMRGKPPLTVSCSDRSSGEITSWLWDWGDGTTPSTERNPSHVYARSGNYEITLTVRGPGGEDRKPFCCIEVLRTGDVRVTLLWSSTADLDLYVLDPNNCMVWFDNRKCPSGGQLDVDANSDCKEVTSHPVENIFWPTGQAPKGEYKVFVNYWRRCSGASSTESFTVRILVDGEERTISGSVSCCNNDKPEQPQVLVTTFKR